MYGRGAGDVATVATGVAPTIAGVAALPNTGDNTALMVLSIATMVAGALVLASFAFTRIAGKLSR